MRGWVRKLRGILGIGALWGFVGGILGTVAGTAVGASSGLPLVRALLSWGIGWGLGASAVGLVLGGGFAILLATLERRRTLEELTPGRAAVWGSLVGAALPVGWFLYSLGAPWITGPFLAGTLPQLLAAAGTYGAVTAGLAAGTVWVARQSRGELPPGQARGDR